MTWDTADDNEVETELVALETYMNNCDAKIRAASSILKGLRAVKGGNDFDGSAMDDTRRETLKTSLIAKSKEVRA